MHGDDFVSVGPIQAASQFKKQLEARFEIKNQVIGALIRRAVPAPPLYWVASVASVCRKDVC